MGRPSERLESLSKSLRRGTILFRERSRMTALNELEQLRSPKALRTILDAVCEMEPQDPIRIRALDILRRTSDPEYTDTLISFLEAPSPVGQLAFEALERIGTPRTLGACLTASENHPCIGHFAKMHLDAKWLPAIAGAARSRNALARGRALKSLAALIEALFAEDAPESNQAKLVLAGLAGLDMLVAVHDTPAGADGLAYVLQDVSRTRELMASISRARHPDAVWKTLDTIRHPAVATAAILDKLAGTETLRWAADSFDPKVLKELLAGQPLDAYVRAAERLKPLGTPGALRAIREVLNNAGGPAEDVLLRTMADMLRSKGANPLRAPDGAKMWSELLRSYGKKPAIRDLAAMASQSATRAELETAAEVVMSADAEVGRLVGEAVWKAPALQDVEAARTFLDRLSARKRLEWLGMRENSAAKLCTVLNWGLISGNRPGAAEVRTALRDVAERGLDLLVSVLRVANESQMAEATAFLKALGNPSLCETIAKALTAADPKRISSVLETRAFSRMDPELVLAELRRGGPAGREMVEHALVPDGRELLTKLILASVNDERVAKVMNAALMAGGGFEGLCWALNSPYARTLSVALEAIGTPVPGFAGFAVPDTYCKPGGAGRARELAYQLAAAPPRSRGELTRFAHEAPVCGLGFTQNGKLAVSISADASGGGDGFVWDPETGDEVAPISSCAHFVRVTADDEVLSLSANGNGSVSVRVSDILTGRMIWQGHDLPAMPIWVAPAPSGRTYAALLPPGNRILVRSGDGREIALPIASRSVALSPDSTKLAAFLPTDRAIAVFDLTLGSPEAIKASARMRPTEGEVTPIFSPDGATLVVRLPDAIECLSLPELAPRWNLPSDRSGPATVDEMAFTADSRLLFVAGRRVTICRAADGKVEARPAVPTARLAVCSTRPRLLTVHEQTIRSWDLTKL